MQMNSQKRESTEITILALLVAHKRGCTLSQLTKDYYEMAGEHIPWRELGYHSLLNLLQSMPRSVQIEYRDNIIFVRGIASDKSKHVSNLVAGQKDQKHIVGRKLHKPSHYYPNTGRQRIHIPAEILTMIISFVNEHPDGVNKDYMLVKVQSHMPYTRISMSDMEEQLQELSHKIYQLHNKIFPVQSKPKNFYSNTPIVTASGNEDSDDMIECDEEDDFQFLPPGHIPHSSKTKSITKIKSTSSFIKETVSKCQDQISENKTEDYTSRTETDQISSCNSHNYSCGDADQTKIEFNNNVEKENYFHGKNVDILINERVKFRLEKLIQNHPNGIWCADLPEKYLEEYKVSLNYTELGFNSVREFASQLPEIFHCVQPNGTGDFMLYYVKREMPLNKSKEKQKLVNLAEMHHIYTKDEEDALPVTLTLDTCKKLIPDGIITIGECVGQLSVTDLVNVEKPYIEVVVVEVFTPSFFWIQLRKRQKAFKAFMDDLHYFYAEKHQEYVIPPVVLEKGLNCACMYNGIWHRGIIKTVKPDLQVTVMFYDYGTLKTYPPEAVYYLHRRFSSVPAQAIPCGLINTRPYKGSKWSRSATHHFAVRTSQIPLIATIASINVEDNSMMVTLTDTLEEEDVHINDWLVEQKLAEHGKMVCMKNRNFPFRYYLECRERFKQKCEASKVSGNYSKNAVALCNLESSSANNIPRASSNDVGSMSHQTENKNLEFHNSSINGIPIEDSRGSTLNFKEKPPRKLKSLYEKLLNLKHNSNSTGSSKKERNNTVKGNEFSSSCLALNETVKQKFCEKSLNNNIENNNKCDVFTSGLTYSNQKEISQCAEYDILKKFNNIPKTYANHFTTQDSEDELNISCTETRSGKYNEQCEFDEVDWSTIRKNMAEKKRYLPLQHVTKTTYKSIPTKRDNIPLAESCFLKAVRNSVYFASRDEDIHWSPTGNVDKNQDVSPVILKKIKKRTASCTKQMTVAVPQKTLELLTGKELTKEPLESLTNVSENISEALSTSSSQGISSVTADTSSYANNEDTFCTETTESNSGDYASRLGNHYVCVTPHTPKYKLLQTLLTMLTTPHDTSDLDSDDLSASDLSVSAQKNTENSNEESKLEDHETYASVDESISNGSYSELNTKDPSPCNETGDTNLDMIESSECIDNINESSVLAEEPVPIQHRSALIEESISLSTSAFTEESEILQETLEEEESIEESIQIEDPLLSEETISSELVPRRESLPPNIITNTSNIPVFNDIDLESDAEEWDLQVSFPDMCDLLKINYPFNKSIEISNQLEQKSDACLTIVEVNDSNPTEDMNIPEKDQESNVCEITSSADQMINNVERSNDGSENCVDKYEELIETQRSVIYPENTVLVPWKSQGKAKTLIEMLKKGDIVDMSNLLLYVEENLMFSPEQCYEDQISEDKCSNKQLEGEAINIPLISPQSTLNDDKTFKFPSEIPLCDELQKLPVIREENSQDQIFENVSTSLTSPLSQTNTNPFLYDEATCNQVANELTPERFIQLWNENLKLQMQITSTFHLLFNKVMKNYEQNTGDNPMKNEKILKIMRNTFLNPNKDMLTSANFATINTSSTCPVTIPSITNSYSDTKNTPMNYDFMNTGYLTGNSTFTDANQQQSLYNASTYNKNLNCSNSADLFQNSGIQNSTRNLRPMYPSPVVPTDNNVGAMNQFLIDERISAKENYTPQFEEFNTQLNLSGQHNFSNNVNTDFLVPSGKPINDTTLMKETNPFKLSLAGKLRISDSAEDNFLKSDNLVSASHRNWEPVTEHNSINFEKTNANIKNPIHDISENLCKDTSFDYYQYFLTNCPRNTSSSNLPVLNTISQPTKCTWSVDDVTSNMSRIIINDPSIAHNINLTAEVGKHTEKDNEHVLNSQSYNYETFAHTPYSKISSQEYVEKQKQKESLVLESSFSPSRTSFIDHYSDSIEKTNEQRRYYTNDVSIFSQSPLAHRNILTTSDGMSNCSAVNKNSISSSWLPINSFMPPVLIDHTNTDEGYLTRPSTSHTSYRSSPLAQVNNEVEHSQQSSTINPNVLCGTPTKMWIKSIDSPPTIVQSENRTTMDSLFKKNENIEVTCNESQPQYSMENIFMKSTIEPQVNDTRVNDLYSKQNKLRNIWKSPAFVESAYMDNKSSIQSNSSQNKKVFVQVVELPKRIVHVFHHQGQGWLLMDEFVKAFTEFQTISYMTEFLNTINIRVPVEEINKTQYSIKVSTLNGMMLEATQNIIHGTNNLQLIPLRTTLKLLKKLKIISGKDIENAVKKEFVNGSVMHEIWLTINAYGQLEHRIENEG